MSTTVTKDDVKVAAEKAREQYRAAREEVKELAKKYFQQASVALFAQFPQMESFAWQQYTVYFNDGDTCTFSVYSDAESLNINDVDYDDTYEYDTSDGEYRHKAIEEYADLEPCFTAVSDFLQAFDEESLLDMFGDHAQVRVDKAGVTVDEYTHHD